MTTMATFKSLLKRRVRSAILFSYGLAAGTATPIVLSRCSSSGGACSTCGGACAISIAIVPLLIYLGVTGRFRKGFHGIGRWLHGSPDSRDTRNA
jgi:hypothetical protein